MNLEAEDETLITTEEEKMSTQNEQIKEEEIPESSKTKAILINNIQPKSLEKTRKKFTPSAAQIAALDKGRLERKERCLKKKLEEAKNLVEKYNLNTVPEMEKQKEVPVAALEKKDDLPVADPVKEEVSTKKEKSKKRSNKKKMKKRRKKYDESESEESENSEMDESSEEETSEDEMPPPKKQINSLKSHQMTNKFKIPTRVLFL